MAILYFITCHNDWHTIFPRKSYIKAGLTAIIEEATERGCWAIYPKIPGANGQGETIEEAKESLKSAIQLILEDRLIDIRRSLSDDAIEETISIP